jgi:hypothetical protein
MYRLLYYQGALDGIAAGWRGIGQKVDQRVEILVARTSVFCARTWSLEMAGRL